MGRRKDPGVCEFPHSPGPPADRLLVWKPTLEGRAGVIAGDTVEVAGQTVRRFGIDAPENGWTYRLDGYPRGSTLHIGGLLLKPRCLCVLKHLSPVEYFSAAIFNFFIRSRNLRRQRNQ